MPGSFPEISKTNSSILNLVRFLCCQGVVVGHALGFLHISHRYVGGLASYCVLLFFILSGFLISYSLLNKLKNQPEYNFWSFFKDRFFRIYPPFLGALIVVVLLDFTSGYLTGADLSIKMYMKNFMLNIFQLQGFPVANILYYQYGLDFFYFRHFGSNFPLWTISIEWWLYMFYGFFIFHVLWLFHLLFYKGQVYQCHALDDSDFPFDYPGLLSVCIHKNGKRVDCILVFRHINYLWFYPLIRLLKKEHSLACYFSNSDSKRHVWILCLRLQRSRTSFFYGAFYSYDVFKWELSLVQ